MAAHRRGGTDVNHRGRLLVATPLIGEPVFERSVIFLLAHGDEGAFGVILNRPSDTAVGEIIEPWAPLAALPGVMFLGGPVGRNAVVGLGRLAEGPASDEHRHDWQPTVPGITTVDLNQPPVLTGEEVEAVRLFAGSAGWAAGQLEDELAEGAWWLVDPAVDDLFCPDPEALWTKVLRRQTGSLAWFANHPGDPTVN